MVDGVTLHLTGKITVVTGSTQGIGVAIARRLAEVGADVVIKGRNEQRVAQAVASLSGLPVPGVTADVPTPEGAQALVGAAGAVDVLVNYLGLFRSTPTLEIEDDEWRRFFDVNVLSAARLTRLVLPEMTGRGWGRVRRIASDSAIVIPAEMIHYGASKSTPLAVSRGFAKATSGTGVTGNSVISGPTHTEGAEDFFYELVDRSLDWDAGQRDFMRTARPQSLIGRLIEPEEIANMVVYRSVAGRRWVPGQHLAVKPACAQACRH